MTTMTVSAGSSTYTLAAEPDTLHDGRSLLKVAEDAATTLLWFPVWNVPVGDTISSAKLRLRRRGSGAITPTVDVQAADSYWAPNTGTWDVSPDPTGTAATLTQASTVDGDLFEIDVTAQVIAGRSVAWFGWVITGTGAPIDFHNFGSVLAPTLELTFAATPSAPTNGRPSGGRTIGAVKPVLSFDAADVAWVKVQTSVARDWDAPDFDSGWVPAVIGQLDLSATAFGGLSTGVSTGWRAQIKNSAGVESPWSQVWDMQFVASGVVNLVYPDATIPAVPTDTPLIQWGAVFLGGGSQASYRVVVTFVDDPGTRLYDSGWVVSTATSHRVPEGKIRDASQLLVSVYVTDTETREAIPGSGNVVVGTQQFSFQKSGLVPPPDFLLVTERGTSPAWDLLWAYSSGTVDTFRVDVDGINVAGAAELSDLQPDEDGNYHWTYYAGSGGELHSVEVMAKKDDKVSAGNPIQSMLTFPTGKWLMNPNTGDVIKIRNGDSDPGVKGEIVTTYYPLHGTDPVDVYQAQRGYENRLTGEILDDADTMTARQAYKAIEVIRTNPGPELPYIIAYPYVAFEATLSNWAVPQLDAGVERWGLEVDYKQIGDLLWIGREGQLPELKLRHSFDFDNLSAGAAVTVDNTPGLVDVVGAPVANAAGAQQGTPMGMRIPNAAGGGYIKWDGSYEGTTQFYFTPRVVASKNPVYQLDATDSPGFTGMTLNLRTAGDIDMLTNDGTFIAKSHGAVKWHVDQTMRYVVQRSWDPGTLMCKATTHLFVGDNLEGTVPDDSFGGVEFPCAQAPIFPIAGNGQPGIQGDYDSIDEYDGTASLPAPRGQQIAGSGTVIYAMTGVQTDTSFRVVATVVGLDDITGLQVAVSTSVDSSGNPVSPTYHDFDVSYDSGANGTVVQFPVTGKTKNTTYFVKLATSPGSFIGVFAGTAKTWPATADFASATQTLKIAFGSCQRNARTSLRQLAWSDILTWGPDWGIHVGDVAYQGQKLTPSSGWQGHHSIYLDQINNLSSMRQAFHACCWAIEEDDHDLSGNNGQSNLSTDTGKVRQQGIQGMQRFLPQDVSQASGSMDDKHGLWWVKPWGPHVNFVFIDNESLDRSISPTGSGDDTYPAKNFLGAEQYAWLKAFLQASTATVNVLIQGKSFMGGQYNSTTTDKPEGYQAWRTDFCTFAATETDGNGVTIEDTILWLGGDIHANVYMSAADNPFGNFPLLGGSGFDMHSKGTDSGVPGLPGSGEDSYTEADGFSPTGLGEVDREQYLQITATDTHATSTVNFHVQSRTTGTSTYDPGTGDRTNPSTWSIGNGWSVDIPFTY